MKHKKISMLAVSDLVDFEAQPYKVLDDEAMDELVESIKRMGILIPIIVRQLSNGMYEIISGHRRKRACEMAGVKEILAEIRDLDDDEAAILLVDSNLHREHLLPSEKAYAYKLKLDSIKHQGKKDEQNGSTAESADIIGQTAIKAGGRYADIFALRN
ncbi:ParB/RepB/Spo0J family partition protein [Acetivibrio sp. MSJd-27]|uniref:ParB/RepB/Spo0J family partition protein n=1 Tax=Acetivibrio sp. MSJd-27 TaxID=2841523 RepID=UPI001C1084BE|nr:ParB/RepB/Spo0J family partition protein [Acetivibrio sp. MSJd-27]MBU5451207.1 ParB/RepB/Spo0J family partition protein [Acetivibrio sp. MSJd-27]